MDGIDSIGLSQAQMLSVEDLRAASTSDIAARSPEQAASRSDQEKEKLAKDFESVLLTRVFEQVRKSISSGILEEDGTSEQVQGLFWLYLAQDVADKGGFGLWKDIYQFLDESSGANVPGEQMLTEL
jgi:Rod binding domain-containing protein